MAIAARDHRGLGYAVVRVAAQNRIQAFDAAGQLQIHIHTVVAEQNHRLRALPFGRIDLLLQLGLLNAEGPVWHLPARISNRRVGEGLPNDGHLGAIHFFDHERLEDRVFKVFCFDVLRHKIDLASKVFFNDLLDALLAIGEFPMRRHHVDAQQLASIDHVLCIRPQAGGAALPSVATIEQQRAGAAGFEALDQGRDVRKTAHLAILPRCALEIEVRMSMGFMAAHPQTRVLDEMLAHQMRHFAPHAGDTNVGIGLAEIDRQQLRMAIGHVQQMHIARFRHVIQPLRFLRAHIARKTKPGGSRRTQNSTKLTAREIHKSPLIC